MQLIEHKNYGLVRRVKMLMYRHDGTPHLVITLWCLSLLWWSIETHMKRGLLIHAKDEEYEENT